MEEEKSVQIKQEYLIYGLAAALIVIIILIGSLLYIISNQNSVNTPSQDINQQLPPGHVPINPDAVPGPLTPEQIKQYEGQSTGQSTNAAGHTTGSAGTENQ